MKTWTIETKNSLICLVATLNGLTDSKSPDKTICIGYMEYGCQCEQHPEILSYAEKVKRTIPCSLCGTKVSSSRVTIMFAQVQNVSPEIAKRSILIQTAYKKEAGNIFRLIAVSIDPQNPKDQHYQLLVCEACVENENKIMRELIENQRPKTDNDGKYI